MRDRKLDKAVDEYLTHRRDTREFATWKADRTALLHLMDSMGPKASVAVIGDGVQEMFDALARQGYNPSTLKTYVRSLSPFFRWAGHPMPRITLPNPGKTDVRTLEANEVARLRKAARKVEREFPGTVLAVEIGLTMGLRQGEIFALRWEAIDAREESVRVQWQIPKDRTVPKPLKGKLARTAFVLPEWWAHHRKARGDIVGALRQRCQRNLIQKVLLTADLYQTGAGWHLLRHQYAREIVERGGRFEELQVFLGHASIVTTQKAYGHLKENVAIRLARERIRGA